MVFPNLATEKYRWVALVFLALGLAIVIIDNTVLNVAVPYIIRDLHTTFDGMQWVISGYALIIATLLITVGRLGDLIGRKKIFLLGTICFAIGSFIASISQNAFILFLGEAFIEALGASMMMTSSLALLASEFQGRERALAFGIWGSVAGASATFGPLMGGFLTTYYSWRWSLRINVFVALAAIIGSIFIQESKGKQTESFDFLGTIFSGLGLFFLIFGFIEGRKYGWIKPNEVFTLFSWQWPFSGISLIPFSFLVAAIFLSLFIFTEYSIEKNEGDPLLRLSMFANRGFSWGIITLGVVSLGQFGVFFILPIFLQTVLGLNAFQTGEVFLSTSLAIAIFGPLSGFISSKIGPKWLVVAGMISLAIGTYLLALMLSPVTTGWTLVPALIFFGIGIGLASAQLTNITLSSAPVELAGEASASNTAIRQVGTSIGIAIIGAVLANGVTTNLQQAIRSDVFIPSLFKPTILSKIPTLSVEAGQRIPSIPFHPTLGVALHMDLQQAIVDASKQALLTALIFVALGALLSLFLPTLHHPQTEEKTENVQTPEEVREKNALRIDRR